MHKQQRYTTQQHDNYGFVVQPADRNDVRTLYNPFAWKYITHHQFINKDDIPWGNIQRPEYWG
jgi:hypothetical protein